MLAIPVSSGWTVVQSDNATEPSARQHLVELCVVRRAVVLAERVRVLREDGLQHLAALTVGRLVVELAGLDNLSWDVGTCHY
jgi:hypothetical protein